MTHRASLDAFLAAEERSATFHDAALVSVAIDYQKRELVSEWDLCVGDPNVSGPRDGEARRRGRLRFTGLSFWVMDAPETPINCTSLPWLTSDGPLSEARTDTATRLTQILPAGSFGWYLYFADWNAFAYCGATECAFEWVQ